MSSTGGVEVHVSPPGRYARVTHITDVPPTVYFEFLDGTAAHATREDRSTIEVGDVVFVTESTMTPVPEELWRPQDLVGVVRLKHTDTTVLDLGGRWMSVPTVQDVDYERGNTVEATADGVTRVLDDEPLQLIELPAIGAAVISKFRVAAPTESFESLGGLDHVIDRARELIEIPLLNDKELAVIGARPIRGVLLTGPAGTGKTLFARIFAAASRAEFYLINGPEVMSKWFGQSEELLRKIFEDARKQASIVFFDEIDSIAGQRTETAHEASNRVVATLLTELDGFTSGDHPLLVLATTNRPEEVDVALRRPGRLDWQIHFPLPDLAARIDILRKTSATKKVVSDLPFDEVAARTAGWSGAELTGIWTEAALLAVQDERDEIEIEDFLGGWQRATTQRTLRKETGWGGEP